MTRYGKTLSRLRLLALVRTDSPAIAGFYERIGPPRPQTPICYQRTAPYGHSLVCIREALQRRKIVFVAIRS